MSMIEESYMILDKQDESNKNVFEDISILVVGYDGYIDVWEHFVYFLNKYWHDRPNTYLATSELEPDYDGVKSLPAGKGSEWSKRALNGLNSIKTKYVLLLLEDFFITDYINNNEFIKIINYIKDNNIMFYQLKTPKLYNCFIEGKRLAENKHIWVINKDCKYGLNLQAAIWNTDFLKETIGKENYNAWVFECKNISKTNFNVNKIEYVIDDRDPLHITHAIVQSKYLPSAINKCKSLGYLIDTNVRGVLSGKDYYIYKFKQLMSGLVPRKLISPIKRLGRHLKFSFVTDKYMETKA